ncbi:MAG: peptide chain release factor 2 [SAR116 cluster bacterium]|nr:peptide chain release factor 2 [SAR116 cluster bacterium]RPH07461.1 MAG: peptide chain release factor 2 [Alphaproteobacteria bacterium TMED54]
MSLELVEKFKILNDEINLLKKNINWEKSILELKKLIAESECDGFWNDPKTAQKVMKEIKLKENKINLVKKINQDYLDLKDLVDLAESENDSDLIKELNKSVDVLMTNSKKYKIETMFSDKNDFSNCFLEIHAGAGGTEAQDWALMLQRMYFRWAEKKGFKVKIIEESPGDEAGIKSSTLMFIGDYANGWSRTESGVHRLVRISPFDSSSRRHTSFASVWIYSESNDEIDIKIDDKDLKIDTYRASGAGGQHVNKTDSAIRITHLPTKIIVQCQSDRSQHRNKAQALSMLRSKLYELELKKQEEHNEKLASSKNEIGWGSQIRSYVLHPYNLVKDLRTNIETGNTNAVLDGEIDQFINEALAQKL